MLNTSVPRYFLIGTFLLIMAVRIFPIWSTDFPLNDGGMFYTMTQDLSDSDFRLPKFTTYNYEDIPYAYPPLGFYLAAGLNRLLKIDLLDVFRWLPVAISIVTIPAFYLFSKNLLLSPSLALMATIIFGFIPKSFEWQIMGGGLTRGLGLLFAILAIHQIVNLLRRPTKIAYLLSSMLILLTVLSHPEAALFVVYSSTLLSLFSENKLSSLILLATICLVVAILSAPWWFTVISYHGLAPFLAIADTRGDWADGLYLLSSWDVNMEQLMSLVTVLGLMGLFYQLSRRRFLLPLWIVTILLLNSRSGVRFLTIPMALLATIFLTRTVLPAMKKLSPVFLIWLIVYMGLSAFSLPWATDTSLGHITTTDRQAMTWIASQSPGDSVWVAIPDTNESEWHTDRLLEWFPALTGRRSLATVQGTEWLPGQFRKSIKSYRKLEKCGYQTVECVEKWAAANNYGFDYVYISHHPKKPCCALLEYSLENSPDYKVVYDQPAAFIAQKMSTSR